MTRQSRLGIDQLPGQRQHDRLDLNIEIKEHFIIAPPLCCLNLHLFRKATTKISVQSTNSRQHGVQIPYPTAGRLDVADWRL